MTTPDVPPLKWPGLPKWPGLLVSGKKITPEQAAEVIIRTDSTIPDFTYASNDRIFERELSKLFGIPENADDISQWHKLQELRERLGILSLSYLHNSQIISSWIGGPHGWCRWSGSIFANNYNIGKWPSISEVEEDWITIAEAFPFLDLRCQLLDNEICEGNGTAMVEFIVQNGTVITQIPEKNMIEPVDEAIEKFFYSWGNPSRERGISIDALKKELERIYNGNIPQYE